MQDGKKHPSLGSIEVKGIHVLSSGVLHFTEV